MSHYSKVVDTEALKCGYHLIVGDQFTLKQADCVYCLNRELIYYNNQAAHFVDEINKVKDKLEKLEGVRR